MKFKKPYIEIDGINVTHIAERRTEAKDKNTQIAVMMEGLRQRQRELIVSSILKVRPSKEVNHNE